MAVPPLRFMETVVLPTVSRTLRTTPVFSAISRRNVDVSAEGCKSLLKRSVFAVTDVLKILLTGMVDHLVSLRCRPRKPICV